MQHFEAHFAHCEEHSLLLPDGHLLVATRGGDGKARIWEALNYLLLFATISTISHSLLQFSQLFSTLLKGGAVCGALHAALGEPLYLIPKLRSDICQTGATLHCVNCAAAAPRSDRVCGSDCCREKCSFWISFPKPLFLAPQLRWDWPLPSQIFKHHTFHSLKFHLGMGPGFKDYTPNPLFPKIWTPIFKKRFCSK